MTPTAMRVSAENDKDLVVLRAIRRSFGRRAALVDFDLRVARGSIVALTGPNGSGKTTALKIAAGLLAPTTGQRAAGAREVAYVPADGASFDELSVLELLELHQRLRGRRFGPETMDSLLLAFGLHEHRRVRLADLSTGLRRAAAIVAAAAAPADLLVIDEATAALDPEAVLALREVVVAHAVGGGGVLLATQDLAFADVTADTVVLLDAGRQVATAAPSALEGSLEQLFLTSTCRTRQLERLHERLRAQ